MNDSSPPGEPTRPHGLLLSSDLLFTSKITGTGNLLGLPFTVVRSLEAAQARIAALQPRLVIADLSTDNQADWSGLAQLRAVMPAGSSLVAFGPHVDRESLASATAAGCDQVLPRSVFVKQLPEIIQQALA